MRLAIVELQISVGPERRCVFEDSTDPELALGDRVSRCVGASLDTPYAYWRWAIAWLGASALCLTHPTHDPLASSRGGLFVFDGCFGHPFQGSQVELAGA